MSGPRVTVSTTVSTTDLWLVDVTLPFSSKSCVYMC